MGSSRDRTTERDEIKYVDLTKGTIKILGFFFSYNKNIELEQNFKKTIIGIEKVLIMW